MGNRWETVETMTDFILEGSKITADGDCSHEIKTLTPWKESYDHPRADILKLGTISVVWTKCLFSSVQSSTQSCPTLCNPMNCSTPGLPVHHHLLEFTQTHIHRVSDAIQPSHPLSSPAPPAPNPSQHQSLFQ